MDIDEFVAILHSEVNEFQKFWVEKSQSDPDHYPSDLEVSDWFEQVDSYNSIMIVKEEEDDL